MVFPTANIAAIFSTSTLCYLYNANFLNNSNIMQYEGGTVTSIEKLKILLHKDGFNQYS